MTLPSLPSPYLILGVVLSTLFAFGFGHHEGYKSSQLESQVAISKLNEKAREEEQAHTAQINNMAFQLTKANQDADAQISKLRADVRVGARRLSVPTTVYTCQGAASATGDRTEARAELDPETSDNLISIANDGDKAIRQLNACIDAYNAIR
jgi:prophage endopeptidase